MKIINDKSVFIAEEEDEKLTRLLFGKTLGKKLTKSFFKIIPYKRFSHYLHCKYKDLIIVFNLKKKKNNNNFARQMLLTNSGT